MKKFDSTTQYIKYKAVKTVLQHAIKGDLQEEILNIPDEIISWKKPTLRCCIYKEKHIFNERIKLATNNTKAYPYIVSVIPGACDECPEAGYEVLNSCRGCLGHQCGLVCKSGAISYDERTHVCRIDKDKCKRCGACAEVCQYNAIHKITRPCYEACKAKAISWDEDKVCKIDYDLCTSCGACIVACPFSAISDRSFVLDVLKYTDDPNIKTYAIIAPSIGSQFFYCKPKQVVTGILKSGFDEVVEAAIGADIVTAQETEEWVERKFLTSSCCPAFVKFVETAYPELKEYVSGSLSPMATIGKLIKEKDPNAKCVFIGPCTAKKDEFKKPSVAPYIDAVITFEELLAFMDAKDIKPENLEETEIPHGSMFGRNFAKSGGLVDAVHHELMEKAIKYVEIKPVSCNGLAECNLELLKKTKDKSEYNFIEGMACVNGCIGGAGVLTHKASSKALFAKYANSAEEKSIADTLKDKLYFKED